MMHDDPTGLSLVERDFDGLRRPRERDKKFRAELRTELLRRASLQQHAGSWMQRHRRVLAVVTGTVLSLIGLFGYAWLTNSTLGEPATASAATLLRRAAAQAVPPGEIGHYVYRVQVHNNGAAAGSGTVDVWFEGRTSPARSTQTVTLDKGAKPGTGSESGAAGRLLGRFVTDGCSRPN
jgi:hypothetical protein